MRSPLGPPSVSLGLATALVTLAVTGCGQGVRQDRSIAWQPAGEAVGFQHNEEGVFVANQEGGQLEKIFEPGPDVLVTSPPLWSPTDRRLIFTTARDPNQQPGPRQPLPFEFSPDGEVYRQRPVIYTCWLREEAKAGQTVHPIALFEAPCNPRGYVAANLAVRWHPRGDRLLFVKQTEGNRHALFEYDLGTRTSRQLFPHAAEAMVFDWTPGGAHLVCVLAHGKQAVETSGVWIGKPTRASWWRVPQSGNLAAGQLPSPLGRARPSLPVWTPDGARFALPTHTPGKTDKDPGRFALWVGSVADRQVEQWAEGPEPWRDLHWAPDRERLGVVRGTSLHLLRRAGELS